jgi:hypothetical protein
VVVYTHLAGIAATVLLSRTEPILPLVPKLCLMGLMLVTFFGCPFMGLLLAFWPPFRFRTFAWVAFVETFMTYVQMIAMLPMVS